MRIKTIQTGNKNCILKHFRCRDGKRTETRIGMEGICITHSCIPPLHCNYVLQVHNIQWNAGMGNTDTLHPNSCFPSLHLKYFRIRFLLPVYIVIHPGHACKTSVCAVSMDSNRNELLDEILANNIKPLLPA